MSVRNLSKLSEMQNILARKLKELKKLSLRYALLGVKAECLVGCLRLSYWL